PVGLAGEPPGPHRELRDDEPGLAERPRSHAGRLLPRRAVLDARGRRGVRRGRLTGRARDGVRSQPSGGSQMRKVSVALAIGFLLGACGGGDEAKPPQTPATPVATTPAPTATPTADAPKEDAKPKETLAQLQEKTGKAFVEAMNAHDSKKLAGLYAES